MEAYQLNQEKDVASSATVDSIIDGKYKLDVIPVDFKDKLDVFERCFRQRLKTWLLGVFCEIKVNPLPTLKDKIIISVSFAPGAVFLGGMLDFQENAPVRNESVIRQLEYQIQNTRRFVDMGVPVSAISGSYNSIKVIDNVLMSLFQEIGLLRIANVRDN